MKATPIFLLFILLFPSCEKSEHEDRALLNFDFAGTVINAGTSESVAGARVSFICQRYGQDTPPAGSTCLAFEVTTDENGRFSATEGAFPGQYRYKWILNAWAEGYFPHFGHPEWTGRELSSSDTTIVFRLIPPDYLKRMLFHVRYTYGEQLYYSVRLEGQQEFADQPQPLPTGDYGVFYDNILSIYHYRLFAKGLRYDPENQQITELCHKDTLIHLQPSDPETTEFVVVFDYMQNSLTIRKFSLK